ncbi:MAG: hypothetical protein II348_02130 [Clostridia bacterium]|nr:hypothetical protein [Clostridia bacterium]
MKKAGCFFLLLVLAVCLLTACAPTEEENLQNYKRIGDLVTTSVYYIKDPLTFDEVFETADLVVKVRIDSVKTFCCEKDSDYGYTIFIAEILECYKNGISYGGQTLLLAQPGTPKLTYSWLPLFRKGDVFLFGVERSQHKLFSELSDVFTIVNEERGVVQICQMEEVEYAVDRTLATDYFPNQVTPCDEETTKAVSNYLIESDQELSQWVSRFQDVYPFQSVKEYLSHKEEKTEKTGFYGANLYVQQGDNILVYEPHEAGTNSLTEKALLADFYTETEIEGVSWTVFSVEEYPDLSYVLVKSGTNIEWTYRIIDAEP